MTTNAQDRRIAQIAEAYAEPLRVASGIGPRRERAVVTCPDGERVVIAPDGEVLASSASEDREVARLETGYDSAADALFVQRPDSEWLLVPPWRCAVSVVDHLPDSTRAENLTVLRDWSENMRGQRLRVFELRRGENQLRRYE